ncbi:MAG: carboxypeptidase regulatory-like domain-containing protein [Acidobacteriaceae bacterium]
MFVMIIGVAAQAQYRASIQGTVSDPSGAVVPGATVVLTDLGTNKALTSTTNASGIYNFNALPPDHFSIVATKTGFQKRVLDDVELIPEQANSVNIQLLLGSETQTVTVSGLTAPLLQTETASVSGTVSSNEIQHLPSFGRDVFQLSQLAPGSFGDGSQAGGGGTSNLPGNTGPGGSGATDGIFKTENGPQIVSNGHQNSSNGITVDGISTVSAVWGGTTVITPSEDSVGDVKIVSNSYDAENGRFSGAQIQVTSKAGTNDVHGSLFFKADRPGLNAYQRYNGPNSATPGTAASRGLLRDNSRFNQFGGSVGGPIWKDKIFAFFSYETLRNNSTINAISWYDTTQFDSQAPAGSLAAKFLTFPGAGVSAQGQINANCGNAGLTEGVNCRTIPGQGLDIGSPLKTGLGTQDLGYVSNSNPGVGSGLDGIADIGEYTTRNPSQITEVQYNGRLDADATSKDRLTFTIYWVPEDVTNYNGPVRAYNLYHHSSINDAFAVLWNHTFSPTFLNEARANAAGWRWNEILTNPQEPFGLPQATISTIGNLNASSADTTFQTFGAPGPSVFNQWTYSYQDVATKVAGRHTIKFGGDVTRLYYLNEAPYNARPGFTFYNVWDFLNDAPEAETGTFDPLTGVPTANRQDNREDLWGFFVQDDFKVKPNLTVNLGIRYSYFGPLSSKQNNLNVAQLGAGAATFTGLRVRRGGNLYQAQKGNFGPQIGFAWSPQRDQNKLVLRGGFGLNFNQEEIAISGNANNNPPGINQPNFGSSSPTQINPSIVYTVPNDVHSLFGYPPNPNTIIQFNANNLPTTGQTSVTGFPSTLPTGYTYHYSLDTQYDLGQQWVATLGYQGSIAHHTIHQLDQNVIGAVFGIPLNPVVNKVDFYNNNGYSNYNAMLAGLKHQFSRSFMLDVQYTWSKSMDDGSQPYYEDPYPYNPRLAYGRSDYNVGQAFKIYGMWQPILFHGNSWLEKLAGGWSISGIFNLHSGFPWTPIYNNITNGNLYFQNSGYGSLRPAAYLGGAGSSHSNDTFKSGNGVGGGNFNKNYPLGALNYFTVPAYTVPTGPVPQTAGAPQNPGVARNFLTGPGYRDVDATVAKAFGIPKLPVLGEKARIEVRADAYNLFNNLNFDPGSITNNISNTTTNNGVTTTTSNPAFGQAQRALGSRTLDIQARFSF